MRILKGVKIMKNCNSYINHPWSNEYGYCMDTKNRDLCSCQGDESKCNYYPEKRNKKMTTLEMMIKAKDSGKTYRADDMLYNTKFGFCDKCDKKWCGHSFDYLNDLFEVDKWQEDNTVYMTKSEAEEKYGITIVG